MLRDAFHEYFSELDLVEMDLREHETIADAIIGSTYVVHTAFATTPAPEHDEPAFQEEAQKQTLVILEACRASKVKRLVMTCAVTNITEVSKEDRVDVYDEEIWSNPDVVDA